MLCNIDIYHINSLLIGLAILSTCLLDLESGCEQNLFTIKTPQRNIPFNLGPYKIHVIYPEFCVFLCIFF